MKYTLILVFLISLLSCQSGKKQASEGDALPMELPDSDAELPNTDLYEPLESEMSSADENYQAGLDFINSYIESIGQLEILEFVKNSPLATEKLKSELENMLIAAWEENPKIGFLSDPLFDAQDYPPMGFELDEFDPETGYLLAKGIEWEDFKVALRVVNVDGHILVDGCGEVNIPEGKRAER
ncbi:MAG TPA: hypothetical protein VNJ50_02370 [Gelidibacter sp.]|uniref:hypothetical protein n=1 Tax=Gelidibacter sp. TaxID=2018083 RepID=UPI002B85DC1B|nr:hypothetical protein [Gelidibacter sp.]HXJ97666.1 hypothetical protein [Gelidibacter sp.]